MSKFEQGVVAGQPLSPIGVLAATIWIVVQLLLAALFLVEFLFGVVGGLGLVNFVTEFGWSGIGWSLILAEIVQPILLISIYAWLLTRLLRRSQTLRVDFISVLALIAVLNLFVATLFLITFGKAPAGGTSGLVFALGAYQFLCTSSQARKAPSAT